MPHQVRRPLHRGAAAQGLQPNRQQDQGQLGGQQGPLGQARQLHRGDRAGADARLPPPHFHPRLCLLVPLHHPHGEPVLQHLGPAQGPRLRPEPARPDLQNARGGGETAHVCHLAKRHFAGAGGGVAGREEDCQESHEGGEARSLRVRHPERPAVGPESQHELDLRVLRGDQRLHALLAHRRRDDHGGPPADPHDEGVGGDRVHQGQRLRRRRQGGLRRHRYVMFLLFTLYSCCTPVY